MSLTAFSRLIRFGGALVAAMCFVCTQESVAAVSAAPAPAVTTAKKSASEQFKDIGASVAGRLRVGASVNTASKISGINIKNDNVIIGSAEANVGNTPAIELQWAQRLYEGPGATKFDWFVGATFERERTLSSLDVKFKNGQTGTITSATQNPTFHANLLSAGLRWTPTTNLYLPVGFNYGFLSRADWGSNGTFDVSPTVGFMAGAGFRLTPQLEIEAVYKMARYDVLLRPNNFATSKTLFDGSVDLNGVVISGRYVF